MEGLRPNLTDPPRSFWRRLRRSRATLRAPAVAGGVPFGPLNVRYTNVKSNGPNDSQWFNGKVVEFLTGKNRARKVYYHP